VPHFASLLSKVLDGPEYSVALQNGFRRCVLYPWNENAVRLEAQNKHLATTSGTSLTPSELKITKKSFKCNNKGRKK